MKRIAKYFLTVIVVLCLLALVWQSGALPDTEIRNPKPETGNQKPETNSIDTLPEDSTGSPGLPEYSSGDSLLNTDTLNNLPYPFEDDIEGQPPGSTGNSLFLNDPPNIEKNIEYNTETEQYEMSQKIGDNNFRNPTYMTFDEYQDYDMDKALRENWRQKAAGENFDQQKAIIPKIHIGSEVLDRIFGGSTVDIRPQGSAELTFALKINKNDNPATPEKQRKTSTFDFDEKIQMSVTGSIGDKMKLTTNYNTEATFDFENKMKLEYTGKEDEIIKKIEAGDVSLPLSGSLITGSQTLFGIKTKLQFGKLFVTSVLSQEKGKKSQIEVCGGTQTNTFDIKADQYEENRHFFLSQYFRDNYEASLENLPFVNSLVNITKIEVWVTGRPGEINSTRNIVAFMDLGEANYFNSTGFISPGTVQTPSNDANNLYATIIDSGSYLALRDLNKVNSTFSTTTLVAAQDYEKVENARLLSASEYTLNPMLGFITINSSLNTDEVLAVAFQYQLNGKTYQVGEFSSGGISAPNALFVKLLKSTEIKTNLPLWNLMMKNVYSVGSYNIQQEGFKLNVLYKDPQVGTPANYLKEGAAKSTPLIEVLNLDNLNMQNDPQPDGLFDFVDGVTINKSNGRIYFPVLEPFGDYLRGKITGGDPNLQTLANKYVYDELYELTKSLAQEHPDRNRFSLYGAYQSSSSSSDIPLGGINIPEGSVTVSAGGRQLTEGVDYTVNYKIGRVSIINEGILNSGTCIKISFESNQLFAIQQKSLMGSRFDYRVSNDLNLGGTILRLTERPITTKINIGDEPISNTIWGWDADYKTESLFLTKLIDKLPLINTKETSTVAVNSEFAHLIPGHSRAVGKEGISYIDDFEGSKSTIDLKSFSRWVLASTPQGQSDLFPESQPNTGLAYGYNRAKLAWYVIDPLFARNNSLTPDDIKNNDAIQSNHYTREVMETEIFPNLEQRTGQLLNMAVFDLAFYPDERGPYNYDGTVTGEPGLSRGVNTDGTLKNPETRWGGIMRDITTNDFEAANIEFIEFWLMDPFHDDNGTPGNKGGDLYFNLGSVSEDILMDGRKSFENGLPPSANITGVDTTIWGRVPSTQAIVDAFDNDADARAFQDVGLDGLSDADEASFFKNYIDSLPVDKNAGDAAKADPSSDNYHYFRGSDYDSEKKSILDRYKLYNGMDSNSPPTENSTESYPTSSTTLPNKEDINRDNTLNENESYYQYKVSLRPEDLIVGQNHITDAVTGSGTTKDGNTIDVKWYQFKIPIKNPEQTIGNIQDFKSIRFIRMFMQGFEKRTVCRFARLELVRSEWRKYNFSLLYPGEYITDDNFDATIYNVSVLNIEENGKRTPIPYILPPDIEREMDPTDVNLRRLNEQSLTMKVCGLEDGGARAAYKITNFDVRSYKRLKMYVHAEDVSNEELLKYGDLTVFIRLGSDFTDNYYEYEIPLTFTPHGTYNSDNSNNYEDRKIVWPESNAFNFEFKVLQDAKQERNKQEQDIAKRFSYPDGKNTVYVKGTPDLSRVNTIMIGVRNPKNTVLGGDALPKCGEVWLNELRVTDFDESSGWAANTRVTAKLADLGTVSLSGNISTPGFGSIDKKVSERSKETFMQYDASSTLQLGEFIPEKAGLKIPMYVGYSEAIIKPQYNPLDPDILMKDALREYDPADPVEVAERDSIKRITRDYTRRKSINFTNVQKTRGKGSQKPHIYDIENLAFTYAYTDIHRENIITEFDNSRTYMGAVSYNFSNRPKNIQPFAKTKVLGKAKYLRPIKDFNFYLMPSQLSFRTDMNRIFGETKPRNTSGFDLLIDTTFAKTFRWNRFYDLKYDITKSLKFDFSAVNNAIIDEPHGRIDTQEKKDSIWENINDFGRTTGYRHTFNTSWTLPVNKIPITDWVSATAGYGGSYDWNAAPLGFDTLGHIIKNSNSKQLNGQFDMVTLYNKVKYFKKINEKYKRGKPRSEPEFKIVKYEKDKMNFKAREPKKIYHKLDTKDLVEFKVYDSDGKEVKSKIFIVSENKITLETQQDVKNAKVIVEAKKKKGIDLEKIIELTARTAMSFRNASFTYTESHGTTLPGYMKRTEVIGQDWDEKAPGVDFLFGYQPGQSYLFGNRTAAEVKRGREEWIDDKANRGWISSSPYLNNQYMQSQAKTLNIKATVEPLPDLRIDITANRNESNTFSEFFRDTTGFGDYDHQTPIESGNFSISFLSLRTAFRRDDDNHVSEIFTRFTDNREAVSKELAEEYQSRNNKYDPQSGGFGNTSQEVLIPAFLQAYAGVKPNSVLFNPFLRIPKPNWQVRYDRLSEIPKIKKYFTNVTLGHAYRSSFNISTFTTNVLYIDESVGSGKEYTTGRNANDNFISKYEINSISISEQFSPLIKIDMTWRHRPLITNFEIKKTRNLSMDFTNNQLTEVRGNEVIVGAGYRFKDVEIPVQFGNAKKKLKSDLVLDAKFSVRDNRTVIRKLVEATNTPLSGMKIISIKVTADYVINQRFNIRAFYDKIVNNPFVSSSFKNSMTNIGFTIRFTLAA